MAIRVRYSISAAVSSTTAEERDLGNLKMEVVTDVETKGGAWKTVLPASTTNLELKIDNLAQIHLLFIRTTSSDPNVAPVSITLKRNSTGAEAIEIKPLGDAKEGHLLLTTNGLTSLYASNSTSTEMILTVLAVGI